MYARHRTIMCQPKAILSTERVHSNTLVYIRPSANTDTTISQLPDTIHEQESTSPDSVRLVLGDFNHVSLDQSLPTYSQYVSCPTRLEKTLDICYGNIKAAYVSHSLFPLGESDHTMIHLTPRYKPVLKLSKPEIKSIQI